MLDAHVPMGSLKDKWSQHKLDVKQVSPSNKQKFRVIVVGSGLAGSSAAASLAELGYQVKIFCLQDSPRRAHSVAAQGGINAAKNYANDGDSVERLFHDMIKGGDYRAREANVYRLAEVSNAIIDQCVAQGVPFTREYDGYLSTRTCGGAKVSRTFFARGQTGQQLLLGAYGALMKEVAKKTVTLYTRYEMLDLVIVNNLAVGIVVRNMVTGKIESFSSDAVILATGGYANIFYFSTNAKSANATAIWRAHKKGAFLANPCFMQIHPTCIPLSFDYQSKLTLISEGLRNDGRIWVPREKHDKRLSKEIPPEGRDYFLESQYPEYGNLAPRDFASRSIKQICDMDRGVGDNGRAVYLDFADAIQRIGKEEIEARYGDIFHMYQKITNRNPIREPILIYPAGHYSMGGLWVDYNLMSNIPGLFVIGEANYSDHGANRLGASGLLQCLADGYFILPYTIGDYLAKSEPHETDITHLPGFKESEANVKQKINRLLAIKGTKIYL